MRKYSIGFVNIYDLLSAESPLTNIEKRDKV